MIATIGLEMNSWRFLNFLLILPKNFTSYTKTIIMKFCLIVMISLSIFQTSFSQNGAPSRAKTIEYINSKFELYSFKLPYSKISTECKVNDSVAEGVSNIYFYDYKFISIDDRDFINYKFKRVFDKGTNIKNQNGDMSFPIDEINSIDIKNDTIYSSNSDGCINKIEIVKHLEITSKSQFVKAIFEGYTTEVFQSVAIVILREGEEDLFSKLKRALINLQSFQPIKKQDPFAH